MEYWGYGGLAGWLAGLGGCGEMGRLGDIHTRDVMQVLSFDGLIAFCCEAV